MNPDAIVLFILIAAVVLCFTPGRKKG